MKQIIRISFLIFFIFSLNSFKNDNPIFNAKPTKNLQQQSSYIDFTISGTKYHFSGNNVGISNDSQLGGNDSFLNADYTQRANMSLYDTNKYVLVAIIGSNGGKTFPFESLEIAVGHSETKRIDRKQVNIGLQVDTVYNNGRLLLNITKAPSSQGKSPIMIGTNSLQIIFSKISYKHVIGTFSSKIGDGDSTITDGKFNVYYPTQ